ncbi:MAG: hypothetical protein ABII18_03255 [bacterium]|nr:hypothetical protein [bacterium]MBU1916964.1 hypothetical protein [bacterium]
MNKELFLNDLIDVYYGESDLSLEDVAKKNMVSLEECHREWNKINIISKRFNELQTQLPTQMSLNKITAYADEKAAFLAQRGFFNLLLKPAFGLTVVLVGFISLMSWYYISTQTVHNTKIASIQTQPVSETSPVVKRLYTTPLDYTHYESTSEEKPYHYQPQKPYVNRLVTNVSVSNGYQTNFPIDDALEQKMMSRTLTTSDFETLYFRARKFEKLGYFQEALHDYLLISKDSQKFKYGQSLPLAIARCYENLGNKKQAIAVLEYYQKEQGHSEETQMWIDLLKSETF